MIRKQSIILLLTLLIAACSTVGAKLEGQYYLNKADYEGGKKAFAARLADNSDDASANYYMGRFELGAGRPEAAKPYIHKAVSLEPQNADYHFWEGVTWWSLQQPDKEKAAYEKTLALNPEHQEAMLYLGHNMLDRGRNTEAIALYDRVLAKDPKEQNALFNKAVALERLGRTPEMTSLLHHYLELYPDGALARKGTEMLNRSGDFSWRNHILGLRTLALPAVNFQDDRLTTEARSALDTVGGILAAKPGLNLHVVAYVKKNKDLAKRRAMAARTYIIDKYPAVTPERLTLSWFGEAEVLKIDGKSHQLPESIAIFTNVK